MDTHVRLVGALNIALGIIGLLLGLASFALYDGPLGIYNAMAGNILGVVLSASIIFHLTLAIPCIVGGFFLLSFEEWSRAIVTFTSALNLLNAPLGSIIGAYGLWVLLAPETEPLFRNPPSGTRKQKKPVANDMVPAPRS